MSPETAATDPVVVMALLQQRYNDIQGTLIELRDEMRRLNDQALDRRVTTLETNLRWVTRTVVGFILSAVIAVIAAVLAAR